VTKSTIIIGVIMLAAVAMFVYFSDSLALRIIAGAIFTVGGVMMYYSIAAMREQRLEAADEQDQRDDDDVPAPQYTYESSAPEPAAATAASAGPKSPLTDPNLSSATAAKKQEVFAPTEEPPVFTDPKEEYDYLTRRLLLVLKEHLLAHTVALFWVNRDRGQLVLGEYATDSKNFTTAKRMNLSSDFISQVGTQGTPELISEISKSSELELLPYYVEPEGVQSFVGVPLFFMNEPIAVVIADSKAPDAFGRETITSINHFVSLIVALLQSYNQKFDLLMDSKMLKILDMMNDYIATHFDSYGIATAATRAITEILDWDHVAIILNNPEKHGWSIVKCQTKSSTLPYIVEGVAVDLERSALRTVVDEMKGLIMDAPKAPAFRFHEKETIDSRGQICAAPLATQHKCYGLAVVEYRESHQYAQKDIVILSRIAGLAAMALENASLRDLTGKHLLVDEISHVPSRGYLFQRLHEETSRITDAGGIGVFFIAGIDKPEDIVARHGDDSLDTVAFHMGKILPEHIKPFDFLGRMDSYRFGLFMVNSNADDAYLRAEKLRKAVTAHTIQFGGLSFSISMSLAGTVVHPGMDAEAVLKLVHQVYERSVSDGGNCVKVV